MSSISTHATAADDGPQRVHPLRRVDPALALGLVGLPPQHRDAGTGQQQRADRQALAGGQGDQQEYADRDRPDRDERSVVGQAALALAGALSLPGGRIQPRRERHGVPLCRQEHPQAGVQHRAEAAERDQRHQAHPHPQHRQAQVLGEPGRDAAEPPVVGGPVGAPGRVRRGSGLVHDLHIVTSGPLSPHQVNTLRPAGPDIRTLPDTAGPRRRTRWMT
jgi:hypothetical protein